MYLNGIKTANMKKSFSVLFTCLLLSIFSFAQKTHTDSVFIAKKDSALKATYKADSLKIEKEFANQAYWAKLGASSIFPAINAGEYSGVIPVPNPTENPDPKIDYKLLFEVTSNNPDSTANENNYGLVEVARIINLHVASGIPLNKIFPVIVVHGGALHALTTNTHYQQRYKMDNPNLKVIADLEKLGTRFIACGQAMNFVKLQRTDMLPVVKFSVTAQTVLSSYQLKGYVLYDLNMDKR